jgi:hypothetical protein
MDSLPNIACFLFNSREGGSFLCDAVGGSSLVLWASFSQESVTLRIVLCIHVMTKMLPRIRMLLKTKPNTWLEGDVVGTNLCNVVGVENPILA